jgi:hypothetical protein
LSLTCLATVQLYGRSANESALYIAGTVASPACNEPARGLGRGAQACAASLERDQPNS